MAPFFSDAGGISSDPRNVFMRRVKTKPASGYANKQYIASTGGRSQTHPLKGEDRSKMARLFVEGDDPNMTVLIKCGDILEFIANFFTLWTG